VSTPWFNLGAWDTAVEYEAACEALARRLAARADLAPGQRALDVGAGACAQSALWLDEHQLARVDAVEPDPRARARAPERADLVVHGGDGADLARFPDETFDRVLSLDAAYHFSSRARFLREAARVLKPGGLLAVVDVAATRAPGALARAGARLAGIPAVNAWALHDFEPALARAGFDDVELETWPDVIEGFARWASRTTAWTRDFPARAWPKVALTALGVRALKPPIVAVCYVGAKR
jgi:erythromycin 3''-O-methyltransferase